MMTTKRWNEDLKHHPLCVSTGFQPRETKGLTLFVLSHREKQKHVQRPVRPEFT